MAYTAWEEEDKISSSSSSSSSDDECANTFLMVHNKSKYSKVNDYGLVF